MSSPLGGDAVRPDARLIPLLNHLAELLAAAHVRQTEDASSAPPSPTAPPRKDRSL